MAFSLLSRYYPSFSPEVIGNLSTFQFHNYMDNIVELEKMMSGKTKEKKKTIEEVLKDAKRLGLKVPKKY